MNEVRRELERAHEAHAAAADAAPQKKRLRDWLRDAVLRRTSTKR